MGSFGAVKTVVCPLIRAAESKTFFEGLGLITEIRPTFYTSIHYLVRPNPDSPLCCEIQVRTLFEEIWGEIDHLLNYPNPSESIACREQLRTLAKLVGTGTRLTDSIVRSNDEYNLLVSQTIGTAADYRKQ